MFILMLHLLFKLKLAQVGRTMGDYRMVSWCIFDWCKHSSLITGHFASWILAPSSPIWPGHNARCHMSRRSAKSCRVRTGVGVVAPAEDAFVGAGERGRCLHAAVALDAVEGVLVAAAAPAQHALRPPAQLHPAVRPCPRQTTVSQFYPLC